MEGVVKRRRGGRGEWVTKLTPEIIEEMGTAIRAGASFPTASMFVGITQSTLQRWLSDGRNAMGTMGPHEEELQLRIDLVRELDEALSSFKIDLTGSILQHGRDNWTALAWLLERKFPQEFGRVQRIEHANPEGEAFRVAPTPLFDPSKLTDEELDILIALTEKARPDSHPVIEARQDLRMIEGG
jgi:hypothetical protein